MTRDRPVDERIRDWLFEEAPGQLPDRVLEATFERTRLSRQRPTILGWRVPPIGAAPAMVFGAAAVILVVIGVALMPRTNPYAGGAATRSPTATPAITPAPSPRATVTPVTGLPGRFAFASRRDGDYDIYVMDPDRTRVLQLTNSPGEDVRPTWAPDGSRIAFASNRDGDYDVYVIGADGTKETRLTNAPGDEFPEGWSADRQRISYSSSFGVTTAVAVMDADGTAPTDLIRSGANGVQYVGGGAWLGTAPSLLIGIDRTTSGGMIDIYRLGVDDGTLVQLTQEPGDDGNAAVSPDGARIAFQSDRNGGCVYVMDADGSDVVQLTSDCRAGFPISWSPEGTWIGWAGDSNRTGPADIRAIDAAGGTVLQLTDSGDVADLAWGPASP
jgi:dipeptidyl aminopeptidase/acylaminoacyl peptidase